jgi:hypothetical protein
LPLYEAFVRKLSEDLGKPVRGGEFGADMKAAIVSDGSIVVALGELKSTKNPKQALTQYRYCARFGASDDLTTSCGDENSPMAKI